MAESVIKGYFPSQVVSDAEKISYDYGLRVAKAIETADDLRAVQKKLMWSNCSACHNRFRAPH